MPTPYIHEIRVAWGHCDPAKIAYTGNISSWALESINGWWEEHLGGDGWYQMELDRNVGTPFVRLEMDFRSPITPRHRLLCHVVPTRLGERSITFRVEGYQDNVLCFEGLFTCVFIIADQFKSQPAPSDIRAIVEPLLVASDPAE